MTSCLGYDLNFTLPVINPNSISSPLIKQLVKMKNEAGIEATIQSCALVCLAEIACTFDLTLALIKTTITIIDNALSLDFDRGAFASNFREVYHLAFVTLGIVPKLLLTGDLDSLSTTFPKEETAVPAVDTAAEQTIRSLATQTDTHRVKIDDSADLFKTTTYLDGYEDLMQLRKFPLDDGAQLKKFTDELLLWTHPIILTQMKEKGLLEEGDKKRLEDLYRFYSLLFPLKAILGSTPSEVQIKFVIKYCNAHLERLEGIVSFANIKATDSKKQCYTKICECFAFFYSLYTKQSDSKESGEIGDLVKKLITYLLILFDTHLKNHHSTDLDSPKRFGLNIRTLIKSFGYPEQDEANLALTIAHYEKLERFCKELSTVSDHMGIVHKAVQVMANSVAHELTQARGLQQAQAVIVEAASP